MAGMGLEIGGYHDRPDWPKMGPSLLISTCLIVAIRTAKWPARSDDSFNCQELADEIQFAAGVASRVMANLVSKFETIFPSRREPLYQATEDENPK